MNVKEKILNFRVIFFCFISFFCAIIFSKEILAGNLFYISFFAILGILLFVLALKQKQFAKVIAVFITFCLGMAFFTIDLAMFSGNQYIGTQTIQGQVDVINKNSIVLKNIKINGTSDKNIIISVYNHNLKLGQIIEFECEIKTIDAFNLGKFDSTAYKHNSPYEVSISASDIKVIKQGKLSLTQKIQSNIKSIFVDNLPSEDVGLFFGIMFGDKSELDFEIKSSYQTSGISHLLAVSGLHVGFLIALLNFLLDKTKIKRLTKFIILSVILFFYCCLCSFSPSVVRASLMAMILLLSTLFGKQYDFVNSISIAGLIILLFSPLSAFDIGFQLSFMAVLSIAFISPFFTKFFQKIKLPKAIAGPLTLSLCVQIGLLPLTATYFGQVSLLSVLTNLICIPLFQIAYIGIFLVTLICIPMSFMGFLYIPFKWIINLITIISSFIASLSMFMIKLYPMNFVGIICYSIGIFVLSGFVNLKKLVKISISAMLIAVVLLYGTLMALPTDYDNLTIYQYSNVCHIIVSSKGEKLLITQNNFVPYNFTNRAKIENIDYIVDLDKNYTEIKEYYNIKASTLFGKDKTLGDFEVDYVALLDRVNYVQIKIDGESIIYMLNKLTAVEEELFPDICNNANFIINPNYTTHNIADYKMNSNNLVYLQQTLKYNNYSLEIKNGALHKIWSLN